MELMKIKKLVLIILAVAFNASFLIAQDNSNDMREKLQFGVKAGANFSNVYDTKDQVFNADYKVGFAAGIFVSIPIGRIIGIQPEMLFSQKGYRASGTLLIADYEFTHTVNYIDIPLLFAFKPSPFVTLLAGPQYSFLIKQKDVFKSGGLTINEQQNFNNDRSVLCFLGGFDVNVKQFVLGARAGWDIQNNNGDGTSTSPRYKNMWYQATLGFKF